MGLTAKVVSVALTTILVVLVTLLPSASVIVAVIGYVPAWVKVAVVVDAA